MRDALPSCAESTTVIGASIYPGVIGTLAVAVTVFLLTFVLPKFYAVFEGKEDVLPWATTFLMGPPSWTQNFDFARGLVAGFAWSVSCSVPPNGMIEHSAMVARRSKLSATT